MKRKTHIYLFSRLCDMGQVWVEGGNVKLLSGSSNGSKSFRANAGTSQDKR